MSQEATPKDYEEYLGVSKLIYDKLKNNSSAIATFAVHFLISTAGIIKKTNPHKYAAFIKYLKDEFKYKMGKPL